MIFVKLLLAHLAGDFLLQPESWVKHKESRKLQSGRLYLHVAVHIALTALVLWDLRLWYVAGLTGLSHFIIDATKIQFQKRKTKRSWFFIDQVLHLLILAAVAISIQKPAVNLAELIGERELILLTAVVIVTVPSSVVIKMLISQWAPHTGQNEDDSLQHAGKYIGILERLFALTFALTGHWEAVGFLITAKSVFRFGDLRKAKDRKMTEYVLIGTLLSFGIALFTGMVASYFIYMV